jgi:rubrerythrin
VVAGVITVVVALVASAFAGDSNAVDFYVSVVSVALAWLLGWSQLSRLQELAAEREAETVRVVAEERQRLARELHDIVSHRVSMMIVQSEAGGSVASGAGDDIAQRFDAIATSGREALAELRRLLGVLRNDAGPDELAPQPGMDRLEVRWDAQAPRYPMGNLIGKREVVGLARDFARERTTSHKQFHDALLDWGATTPALSRWGMGLGPRPVVAPPAGTPSES